MSLARTVGMRPSPRGLVLRVRHKPGATASRAGRSVEVWFTEGIPRPQVAVEQEGSCLNALQLLKHEQAERLGVRQAAADREGVCALTSGLELTAGALAEVLRPGGAPPGRWHPGVG